MGLVDSQAMNRTDFQAHSSETSDCGCRHQVWIFWGFEYVEDVCTGEDVTTGWGNGRGLMLLPSLFVDVLTKDSSIETDIPTQMGVLYVGYRIITID